MHNEWGELSPVILYAKLIADAYKDGRFGVCLFPHI